MTPSAGTTTPNLGAVPLRTSHRVSRSSLLAASIGLTIFLISLGLLPLYTAGDQEAYRPLYEDVRGYSDWESKFNYYLLTVGAVEPFYLLLVNALAGVVPKDVAFSALNGLLAGIVSLWLLKQKVALTVVALLMMNAYLMVLFFSAERLKVALLLFSLAFLLKQRWRWPLFLLAVLTQLQTSLLLLVYLAGRASEAKGKRRWAAVATAVLGLCVTVATLSATPELVTYLRDKADYYAEAGWGGWGAIWKPMVFLLVALYYARSRVTVLATFAPLVVATYFLGSERLALFSYFLCMVYIAPYRRGWTIPMIVLIAYYGYGGIDFIVNFVQHGQGLSEDFQ